MYVKICGLSTPADVEAAIAAGADAIGFVFSQRSPRHVSEQLAKELVAQAAGRVDTVIVTNELSAADAASLTARVGADVLQLHGNSYQPEDYAAALAITPRIWRAQSLRPDTSLEVGAYGEEFLLLDAPMPGSGQNWDASAVYEREITGPWLLAGGLNPDNVATFIAEGKPHGVDVSSGVESHPGVKDPELIKAFVQAARFAKPRKLIRVVGAAIIQDSKVLAAKRGPEMKMPGLWEFPGGKIELGESPEHALKRELHEELGFEAEIGTLLSHSMHSYDDIDVELSVYLVARASGDITATEHEQLRWLRFDELNSVEWAPADLPAVAALNAH